MYLSWWLSRSQATTVNKQKYNGTLLVRFTLENGYPAGPYIDSTDVAKLKHLWYRSLMNA